MEEKKQRNQKNRTDYTRLFLVQAEIPTRSGKQVSIRKKHHERITKIVQVIGRNKLSIFSYIDNVLNSHFATYQDEITELYNKNHESIF